MGICEFHSSGSGQRNVVKKTMNLLATFNCEGLLRRSWLASSADCKDVICEKKTPYGFASGLNPCPVSVCTVANVRHTQQRQIIEIEGLEQSPYGGEPIY
jgi:hypothetical protein